jgi:hypothetical protein
MAPNLSSPDNLGDINHRDAVIRHKYQRANGSVNSLDYTISGNATYNTVTNVSSLASTDSSGQLQIFTKNSGNATTSIDTTTQTAALTITNDMCLVGSNTLKASGNLKVSTTTMMTSGNTFSVTLGGAGNVDLVNSSGSAFAHLGMDGLSLTGNLVRVANTSLYQSGNVFSIGLSNTGNTVSFVSNGGATFASWTPGMMTLTGNTMQLGNTTLASAGGDFNLSIGGNGTGNINFVGNGVTFASFSSAGFSTNTNTLHIGNTTLSSYGNDFSVTLGGSGNINFVDNAGTTFTTLSSGGIYLLSSNSSLDINNFVFSPSGANLDLTLPLTGNTGQVNIIGTSGTFSTIAETGMYISGTLTVDSDVLATADFNVTGDTTLYGDLTVAGNAMIDSKLLMLGATANTLSNTGLLVGSNWAAPTATFLYQSAASKESTAAWSGSIPLLYSGNSMTAQLGGNGSCTVYTTSNTAEYTDMSSTALNFNNKWRLRYDAVNDKMVFEYNSSGTWATKFTVT